MALHCPATLLVAAAGDEDLARALAQSLRMHNVSEVISSPSPDAVACAEAAAEVLGLTTDIVTGLQEIAPGEGKSAVLSRYRDALEELSDSHRGQSVLTFSHPEVMACALLALADVVPHGARTATQIPAGVAARVDVDADGIRILSWPGLPAPTESS